MTKTSGLRRLAIPAVFAMAVSLVMTPSAAFALLDPTQKGGGDAQGGLWYVADQGIAEAHAQGHRGQGVKVAIIDTRINTELPELAGADIQVHEPSYCKMEDGSSIATVTTSQSAVHGSNMAALVAGDGSGGGVQGAAPDAQILYYNTFVQLIDVGAKENMDDNSVCGFDGSRTSDAFGAAFAQAVADGADIISISIEAGYSDIGTEALIKALHAGVIVVTAYPNSITGDQLSFPLVANGTFAVMSYDAAGQLRPDDELGTLVSDGTLDIVSPGVDIATSIPYGEGPWVEQVLSSGNSAATALTSGMIAVVMSKYPDATGNQIIQSILRNTEQGNGEIKKDPQEQWGYGKFDLARVLAQDPAQYSDVNPLIVDESGISPTYEEIMGSADPEPSEEPVAVAPESSSGVSQMFVWFLGGVALIVVAAVSVVAILNSRKKKAAQRAGYRPGYVVPPGYPTQPNQPWQQTQGSPVSPPLPNAAPTQQQPPFTQEMP